MNELKSERITWLDEMKGALIFLVVLGHMTSSSLGDMHGYGWLPILRRYIYSIHMPMFMLISGYLSKKSTPKKAVIQCFLPYVTFQFIYVAVARIAGGAVIFGHSTYSIRHSIYGIFFV